MKKSKLDVYSMQIVVHYLKIKQDFLNVICTNKKFEYVLDRLRINPIIVNAYNRSLFPYIQTQQLNSINNEQLDDIDKYQLNYEIDYEEFQEKSNGNFKCKKIVYTNMNREDYGDEIPPEINIIGNECFSDVDIEYITIPDTITEIRSNAFSECFLKEIIIPPSVQIIGSGCFASCGELTKVILPNTIKILPANIFFQCSQLSYITLPTSITELQINAFSYCGLREISLHENIKKIGKDRNF